MQECNHNCIICGEEFSNSSSSDNLTCAKINISRFKVCPTCLTSSSPEEDFEQVKKIVANYLEQIILEK